MALWGGRFHYSTNRSLGRAAHRAAPRSGASHDRLRNRRADCARWNERAGLGAGEFASHEERTRGESSLGQRAAREDVGGVDMDRSASGKGQLEQRCQSPAQRKKCKKRGLTPIGGVDRGDTLTQPTLAA